MLWTAHFENTPLAHSLIRAHKMPLQWTWHKAQRGWSTFERLNGHYNDEACTIFDGLSLLWGGPFGWHRPLHGALSAHQSCTIHLDWLQFNRGMSGLSDWVHASVWRAAQWNPENSRKSKKDRANERWGGRATKGEAQSSYCSGFTWSFSQIRRAIQ